MNNAITVCIPTTGRPDQLRFALWSVRGQVGLDPGRIRVLVSENSGCEESAAVCAEFAQMDVEFALRDPVLPFQQHIATILRSTAGTGYVALLCDDDWLLPGHLACALRALEREPSVSGYFAAHLSMSDADATSAALFSPRLLRHFADEELVRGLYGYSHDAVLAMCWAFTPFSFSSMVIRGEVAEAAAVGIGMANDPYYADRMIYPAISEHGSLLFNPLPGIGYRVYQGNWTSGQDAQTLDARRQRAAQEVEELARACGADLLGPWKALMQSAPGDLRETATRILRSGVPADDLMSRGLVLPAQPPTDVSALGLVKKAAKRLLRRQ